MIFCAILDSLSGTYPGYYMFKNICSYINVDVFVVSDAVFQIPVTLEVCITLAAVLANRGQCPTQSYETDSVVR